MLVKKLAKELKVGKGTLRRWIVDEAALAGTGTSKGRVEMDRLSL